jgi:arylsulfatase A-like enzyme
VVKSAAFYDCLTRVPLIVSWPGRVAAGATDTHLVSLLDVLPTCLELAGVPVPPGLDGRTLPGLGADPPRDAVFAEYGAGGPRLRLADLPRLLAEPWPTALPLLRWREAEGNPVMVRLDHYKYIYDPTDETDELYDLATDPWELTNQAQDPAYAAARTRLRDRLLAWALRIAGGAPTPLYFDPATGRDATTPFLPAARDDGGATL